MSAAPAQAVPPACVREHPHGYTVLDDVAPPSDDVAPVDEHMLDRFVAAMLRRCSERELRDLGRWIDGLPLTRGLRGLSCGTKCSGTDSPALVLAAIVRQLSQATGVGFGLICEYAAEVDASKRAFIAKMHPSCQHIFSDLHDMVDPGEAAWDWKWGLYDCPRPVTIEVSGFPCTDVSSLNSLAGQHRTIIENAGGKTGSCFKSILMSACNRRLPVLILENVVGLSYKGQLHQCIHAIKSSGYRCRVFYMQPLAYFSWPVRRPRLWFMCIHGSLTEHVPAPELHALMGAYVARLVGGHARYKTESILLPEGHPSVLDACENWRATRELRNRRKLKLRRTGETPKWVGQHIDASRDSGVQLWNASGPSAEDMRMFPGLLALSERETEMLHLLNVATPSDPLGADKFVDVNDAVARADVTEGEIPCITPSARIFACRRNRLLVAEEFLRGQGIIFPHSEAVNLVDFRSALLCNLAGNAFQTHTCAAIVLASLMVVVECGKRGGCHPQMPRIPVVLDPSTSPVSGDDNNDDDVDFVASGGSGGA